MIRRILERFYRREEPQRVDDFIDTAMRCAKAKHVLRKGVTDEDVLDAIRRTEGDTQ